MRCWRAHLLSRLGHRPVIAATAATPSNRLRRGAGRGRAVRSRADGRAYARHGRDRGGPPHARRRGEPASERPIIALTADAGTEIREACLAAGMDGFVVKPLDRERLREALAHIAAAHAA